MDKRPWKKLDLNQVPTRHLYDSDEPEPIFEPPTPMRHNMSLPDDIGQWQQQRRQNQVGDECKQYFTSGSVQFHPDLSKTINDHHPDLDTANSQHIDPTFYPFKRFQTSTKQSSSQAGCNTAEKLIGDSGDQGQAGQYFMIHDQGSLSDRSGALSSAVARSGLTAGGQWSSNHPIADHSTTSSMPNSAQPSPALRPRFSPRVVSDMLSSGGAAFSGFFIGGGGNEKKVELSNFDLSVIAPQSM